MNDRDVFKALLDQVSIEVGGWKIEKTPKGQYDICYWVIARCGYWKLDTTTDLDGVLNFLAELAKEFEDEGIH